MGDFCAQYCVLLHKSDELNPVWYTVTPYNLRLGHYKACEQTRSVYVAFSPLVFVFVFSEAAFEWNWFFNYCLIKAPPQSIDQLRPKTWPWYFQIFDSILLTSKKSRAKQTLCKAIGTNEWIQRTENECFFFFLVRWLACWLFCCCCVSNKPKPFFD